jgi:hypothetical protein
MLNKRKQPESLQDSVTITLDDSGRQKAVRISSRSVLPDSLPFDELTPPQKKFLLSFLSTTKQRLSKPFDQWFGCWITLNSSLLKKIYGGSYKSKVIQPLISLGLLKPRQNEDGKQTYRSTAGDLRGYSKKYRLSKIFQDELLRGQVKQHEFTQKISIKKLEKQIAQSVDRTDVTDPACLAQKLCLDQLDEIDIGKLLSDLQARVRAGEKINVELTIRKALMLNYKQANVTRGKNSGRIFSSANHGGSKSTIPYWTVGGEKVSEVDFKNMHVTLLAYLVKDIPARKKFLDYTFKAPYDRFIDPRITDPVKRKAARDRIKVGWQKALSNSSYNSPEAKVILNFLEKEHPEVYKIIKDFAAAKKINKSNNIQLYLQKMESSIMGEILKRADFWRVSRHDSLVCKESDVRKAKILFLTISLERLGYGLQVSCGK